MFLDAVGEEVRNSPDSDIKELLDLIEHEPQRGGLLGCSPSEHDRHSSSIHDLILRLEAPKSESPD